MRSGLGLWPNEGHDFSRIEKVLMETHLEALSISNCDLVGFHGQTLNHDPKRERTFQIGDGSKLASLSKKTVIWDFRSRDVEKGGQGAPLAPFFHHSVTRYLKEEAPIGFLNLGGVGNITIVNDPEKAPEHIGNLVAFDTGPANAPIDDLVSKFFAIPYDADGGISATGYPDLNWISKFLEQPFFRQKGPKSLDRNEFSNSLHSLTQLEPASAVATATKLVSACVQEALKELGSKPNTLIVTGGGRRNKTILRYLKQDLNTQVKPTEDFGLNGDAMEAQAFGFLAVRTLRDMPISAPSTTGVNQPCVGGKISVP